MVNVSAFLIFTEGNLCCQVIKCHFERLQAINEKIFKTFKILSGMIGGKDL